MAIKITKKSSVDASKSIKAETDAEMTERHEKEYAAAKADILKQLKHLLDTMEMAPGNLFEDMELGSVYEEILEAVRFNS